MIGGGSGFGGQVVGGEGGSDGTAGEWGDAARRCCEPTRTGSLGEIAMDTWYLDDNRVYIVPHMAEKVIKALDEELKKLGAERGVEKSTIRIVCPESETSLWTGDNQAWKTPYIQSTCTVQAPNEPAEYLGTMVSAPVETTKSLKKALEKKQRTRGRG